MCEIFEVLPLASFGFLFIARILIQKRGGLVHWTLDREVWVLADLPGLLWSTLMLATLH